MRRSVHTALRRCSPFGAKTCELRAVVRNAAKCCIGIEAPSTHSERPLHSSWALAFPCSYWSVGWCTRCASRGGSSAMSRAYMRPHPSVERTVSGALRAPPPAAHLQR